MNLVDRLFQERVRFLKKQDVINKMYSTETLDKLDAYIKMFKDINFFQRNEHDYGTKYYLQNKQKTDLNNIQESLKEKITILNDTFSSNAYFLSLTQERLEKKNNKHNYNVFRITMIEYQNINLYYDIILENLEFFNENQNIATRLKMGSSLKIKFYDKLTKFLKANKSLIEFDIDNDFYHHEKLLTELKTQYFKFFLKTFNPDKEVKSMLSLLYQYDETLKTSLIIDIPSLLNWFIQNDMEHDLCETIIDTYINKNWDINMLFLNVDIFKKSFFDD